ncbi:MAG: hypothetical protein AB1714_15920 [Acidobacteriota bacterium]
MAVLELSEEQVLELIDHLRPELKRAVLLRLADDARARRESRMALAEAQLRRNAAERGLDWETMSDDERQRLVDDLVHEDRRCS